MDRIYLREMNIDDTDDIVRWRNSDSVRKYFIYQGDFTTESHLNWIEQKIKTRQVVQFIIVENESEKSIGSVYLRDIDRNFSKAEYGIFIGDDNAKGKGYGTQATKLMLQYAFEVEKLHRIYLRVYADNTRAISSYVKAGFSQEGVLVDDVYVNGEYRDIVWMAAINPKDN